MPMYLSIQLASSGASTSTTGALRILCWASISTASARLVSDFISITAHNDQQLLFNQVKIKHKTPNLNHFNTQIICKSLKLPRSRSQDVVIPNAQTRKEHIFAEFIKEIPKNNIRDSDPGNSLVYKHKACIW